MKTKLFFILPILIIGLHANMLGQNSIDLTFTAQHNGQHVSLDSIMIMNLTQGGDTMLYEPDTILLLEYDPNTGLNEYNLNGANSFTVSPNYPNPFVGQTSIDIRIAESDDLVIRIFDLSGRVHTVYEGLLEAGKHTFTFYPGNESFYICSAFYRGLIRSIKIANPLSSQTDCKVTYKGFERHEGNLKLHPSDYLPFNLGDTLRYIGYSITTSNTPVRASDVIEDIPLENTTYTFDVSEGVPCVNVPTVNYQDQIYNTVQIGTQCWLHENMNVGTMIPGGQYQVNNDTIEKYCYDNASYNCVTYGGLYQWDEIMGYSNEPGIQGICPPGWHIPTDEEFKQLEGEVDSQYGYPDPVWDTLDKRGYDVGLRLKSRNLWVNGSGTDAFGFSALATGCYVYWDETFASRFYYTSFWSSDEKNSVEKWYRYVENYHSQSTRYPRSKHMGRSVRCLRN